MRTHVTVAPLTFVTKIFVCPDVADGKWLVKQGWQQLIGDKSRNGIVDVLIVETPYRHIVAGKCRQSLVCGMQVALLHYLVPARTRRRTPWGRFGVLDLVRCEETCPVGVIRTFVGLPQECGVA